MIDFKCSRVVDMLYALNFQAGKFIFNCLLFSFLYILEKFLKCLPRINNYIYFFHPIGISSILTFTSPRQF